MNKVLVTGGGHLLDYHVIKRLNERGIRPRSLVLPGSDTTHIKRLSAEPHGRDHRARRPDGGASRCGHRGAHGL